MASTINASTSSGLVSTADTSGVLQLQTANTTAVTITSGQLVGIGTTTPTTPLEIKNSTVGQVLTLTSVANNIYGLATDGTISSYTGGVLTGIGGFVGTSSAHPYIFRTNNTEKMRIDSAGNVGIGATPTAQLQVFTQDSVTGKAIRAAYDATYYTDYTENALNCYNNNYNINVKSGSNLIFKTADTERMRIDSSGNVIVNDTAILANSAGKLQVACSAPSSGNQYGALIGGNATQYTVYAIRFLNTYVPSFVGSITIGSTSTAYNTSSDYRLKEDIAPMTGALNTVSLLKPVTYKWKNSGEDGQGFIAHELAEVLPEAVTGEKDAVETVDDLDEDGKVIGTKEMPVYQGIDTSFLVATLTAAIQEQQALITDLTTRLAALEGAK
jgi:hypothetical protein